MVPKVNRFDFYAYETIDGKLIQLVGESADLFEPQFLSQEQILKIQKRANLCEILSSIEFRIDSYGLINFFVEYDDEFENFKRLKKLLFEFNDSNAIAYIEKSLQFFENNYKEFEELKGHPNNYEEKHKTLQSKLDFNSPLHESTTIIDNAIRKNPDNFCFDESGQSIDPLFTGKLQRFYPNGNLKHEYHFVNGRAHGPGLNFNLEGKRNSEILFEKGRRIQVLRWWDKDGNEKQGY